ncbi:MAG: hypothetical protein GX806_02580 [Lentisphaerae bacterium]|jgi:hypothetical protein|nr:hypothetical protein [Lentisphaerota bacterium]
MIRRWSFWSAAQRRRRKRGQALVEYLVITGILLATLAILTLLLVTFKAYGARILDLLAADYP